MRGLDLFAGIGLFGEGMRRGGIEVAGFCELADWKRMIHRELHGAMPEWRDIREMRGEDVLERAGPIDIVFGSPPCTDASLANSKGKGIYGAETGLFMEAIRVIREIRPNWVALENTPGLTNRGADGVFAELEEAGYAVWPLLVGTKGIGAPHDRKRIFLVGCDRAGVEDSHANGEGQQRLLVNGKVGRQPCKSIAQDPSRVSRNAIHDWAGGLGRYLRVADGLPAKTARMLMSACGDGVVVEVAEAIGRSIMSVNHFTAHNGND